MRAQAHFDAGEALTALQRKQFAFSALLPHLLDCALAKGYDVQLGELWRPPEMAAIYKARGTGIKNSLHELRLAVDLILYRNGIKTEDRRDYEPLGRFWGKLSTLTDTCCWGGDFKRPDVFHFSLEHQGIR